MRRRLSLPASGADFESATLPNSINITPIRLTCLLAALVSLWMRTGFPIHGIAYAGYDDGLFVQLARSLGTGQWLGPFDNRTLVKGTFYPLFILVSFVAGIPLKMAEQGVYLVSAYVTASTIRVYTPRVPWFAAVVFIALAFNPMLWTNDLARVIREGLYISLSLATVALSILASFPVEHRRPSRWRSARVFGALAGLVGGCFWLTREEGMWLIPSVSIIVALALADTFWGRSRHTGTTMPIGRRLINRALPWVVALLVWLGVVGTVATINRIEYGVFETTEVQSYAFRHGYGALARIQPDHWQRFVVFPKDARERAYAVSSAARELAATLDGPIGEGWRKVGCAQTGLSVCPEILAGWFQWALRDAVAQAGHYHSAAQSAAFYTTLADQIDEACDQGALPCLPKRTTLAPPFQWTYLGDTLRTMPQLAGILLDSGADNIGVEASQGPVDLTARFADFVGPVKPVASTVRIVRGWVASSSGPPMLRMQKGDGSQELSRLDRLAAPDVAAAYPGQDAIRFELQMDCSDPSCTMVVTVPGHDDGAISVMALTAGTTINQDGFLLYVDSAGPANQETSASERRQDKITQIAEVIARMYRLCLTVGTVFACAGVVAYGLWGRWCVVPTAILAAALSCAAGVVTRIILLSYLEVTAIPSANRLYASPASPLLIVFVMAGCYLGGSVALGWWRDRSGP